MQEHTLPKRRVHKITDDIDRSDVLCTTYQMRNFYRQLHDGFFSTLDIFNYIQHHQIAHWCTPQAEVLDVCCGRGLMLPLLRYHAKHIAGYTGVDIEPRNAVFTSKRVPDGKPVDLDTYYPFAVRFVEANVAEMAQALFPQRFNVLIYTSALEHMHPDAGLESLRQCRAVAAPGARLILTCPNTPEGQDGYNTQYRAHVYEWKRSEVLAGLEASGWRVITEYGLHMSKRVLKQEGERLGLLPLIERLEKFIPNEWLLPVFSPFFPHAAKELGYIAEATDV